MDLLYAVPGLLAALVLHEVAHGYVAYYFGDPTAKRAGRLTLNPIAHLDLLGVVMFWIFHFGWAKPVPVNPRYFRRPRLDMMWVALAGPLMNLLIAYVALLLLGVAPAGWIVRVLDLAAMYNVFLAVFNVLPIPPLDGSKVLAALSDEGARLVASLDRWGWILLLIVVYTGVIDRVLLPMATGVFRLLGAVSGQAVLP